MQFTYDDDRYAIPYPHLEQPQALPPDMRREATFLPDQILSVMEEVVRPTIRGAWQSYFQDVFSGKNPEFMQTVGEKNNRIVLPQIVLAWDETQAIVQKTIERVDPAMAKHFARAIEQGWIDATEAAAPGLAKGLCSQRETQYPLANGRPAAIRYTYDNTINDPVYWRMKRGITLLMQPITAK